VIDHDLFSNQVRRMCASGGARGGQIRRGGVVKHLN